MSNARENFVSLKIPLPGAALGLLAAALYLAPGALGQSQSASSTTPTAQAAGQASAPGDAQTPAGTQTKAAASQAQPELQNQSAPPPQSLGEAARLARAQKPKTETTKVYTEDKLSGLSSHGVSSVGSGNHAAGSYGGNSNSGAATGSGSLATNEAYWRGRVNAIRGQMAQLDGQIAGIRDEIKKKGAVTVDPMSGAAAGVIYVEDRNMQIRDIEAQKQKLQDQLDALAEEGRKAGADSGWFR